MKVALFITLLLCTTMSIAQNVGIGTATPDPSAKLHISDANRGLLIPNVSLSDTSLVSPITAPATGLLVWNTNATTVGGSGTGYYYYYWNGTQWVRLLNSVDTTGEFRSIGGIVQNTTDLANDDFVFGSPTLDYSGSSNARRMFFDKSKGAFRAGFANGSLWNAAQIGSSSIAFGYNTIASGGYSAAMGYYTRALGSTSIAMGNITIASGNSSTSTGYRTRASGNYSTAMGNYVSTNNRTGSFIIGDYSTNTTSNCLVNNQMMMRFAGGYRFYTNSSLTAGARLNPNGSSWTFISDSTQKENFISLKKENVLSKIAAFNITEWNYKSQKKGIRHIGPMAQEFHSAFGLGVDNVSIVTSDISGVNMLAIQGLIEKNNQLEKKVSDLEQKLLEIVTRMERLESGVQSKK